MSRTPFPSPDLDQARRRSFTATLRGDRYEETAHVRVSPFHITCRLIAAAHAAAQAKHHRVAACLRGMAENERVRAQGGREGTVY